MGNWTIRASVCYDMGKIRKNNEDAYFFNGQYAPLSKMDQAAFLSTETNAAGSLWAVCDGMGGQSNGEIASFTAVSGLQDLQRYLGGREFEPVVQSWVRQANRAVCEQAAGGGSTLAMLYCSEQYIQTAHIGDSRIYRFHNGELIRLTRDHSKVEMLLSSKLITPEEAVNHPQKHAITRYLGMDSEYICEASVGKKVPLCDGDRYLLCSDGITDMLDDGEIAKLFAEHEDVSCCAEEIRKAVIKAGAVDNLTAIVLEIAAKDRMDTVLGSESYLPEDEPTEGKEKKKTKKADYRVDIRIQHPSGCEVVLRETPSNVSVNITKS